MAAAAPPLFDVGSVLMNPDRGTIDHLQVAIVGAGHGIKDAIPDADLPPADEPVVAGRRGTIALRDVGPRRAGAQSPEDTVEDLPIVSPGHAARLVRQQRRDHGPLKIGYLVAAQGHELSSHDLESAFDRFGNPVYEFVT
jgi:hypothetical protein